MFYYIVAIIIFIAILMYFFLEFIHLPNKIFKKYSKIAILFILISIVIYLMRFFPAIISTIPAIFLILYRWGNILKFIASIFLKRNYQGKAYLSVRDALTAAKSQSLESDLIFVGGSTFVVSEVI